jgi:hypothetical protein
MITLRPKSVRARCVLRWQMRSQINCQVVQDLETVEGLLSFFQRKQISGRRFHLIARLANRDGYASRDPMKFRPSIQAERGGVPLRARTRGEFRFSREHFREIYIQSRFSS